MNQVQWATQWYGLESLLDIRNPALGFAVLFLARINGLLYIINTIEDDALKHKSGKSIVINTVLFLVFFLFFIISLLITDGFAVNELTGIVSVEKYKYLHNFIQMPVVLILFLAGVVAVLFGIGLAVIKKSINGVWFTGAGSILAVFSLFLVAGFNGTSFYPSSSDLQSSLTIRNASSSLFTLKAMMYVSFIIPVVIGYIWYAWRAINNTRITNEEMRSEGHVY
jgi:cytochrome d ubiquinol oxidase subunit II